MLLHVNVLLALTHDEQMFWLLVKLNNRQVDIIMSNSVLVDTFTIEDVVISNININIDSVCY